MLQPPISPPLKYATHTSVEVKETCLDKMNDVMHTIREISPSALHTHADIRTHIQT